MRAFFGPKKMRWAAVEWGGWTAHGGGWPCCDTACSTDSCHTQATIEMAYTTAFQYEDCRIVSPYAWESVLGNVEAQNAARHFILNWREPSPAGYACVVGADGNDLCMAVGPGTKGVPLASRRAASEWMRIKL